MTMENYPKVHEKKMKLLSYFSRYMKEHLVKTGADMVKEYDSVSRTPHLNQWCRSTSGVLMLLSSGILQVISISIPRCFSNFKTFVNKFQINFGDHTKIIMCPLMAAVTYIEEDKSFRTFRFSTIEEHCLASLFEKIRYAYDKVSILLENEIVKA